MKKFITVIFVMVMVLSCMVNASAEDVDTFDLVIEGVTYRNVIEMVSTENEDGTVDVTIITADRCFVHEAIHWIDVTIYQNGLVPAWNWIKTAGEDAWTWTSNAASTAWDWTTTAAENTWNWVTGLF